MITPPIDPANPDEPPFMVNDGRPRVGLRLIAPEEWLDTGSHTAGPRAERAALLDQHADRLVARLPEGDEAASELAVLVQEATGLAVDPSQHPIEAAVRLAVEDFCVLTGDPPRLTAAAVVHPFDWSLEGRLGTTVDEIHHRVPHYAPLSSAVDRVLSRLGSEIRARTNWFVTDAPDRCWHPDDPPAPTGDLFIRMERQTVRRLPVSRAVVFTIRTYVDPIESIADRPALRTGLGRALRAMTPEIRAYAQMSEDVHQRALDWCESR